MSRLGIAAGVGLLLLTGCSSTDEADIRYASAYGYHPPLAVVGYPSTGTLGIAQELVWGIAEADPERLASLAGDKADTPAAKATAGNWVDAFGDGARGQVTADFYDEGSKRQLVVLYFHKTQQVKAVMVAIWGNAEVGGWCVIMDEPDPREASAQPLPWIPAQPGGAGSKTPL
ncbi:hypothetical protein [Streptomyces sp. NPDC058623]|uniref:hypothetical protein n=1 Tax=Streptomyces sp. NPDC058623 TaxID=3346563 RepID=UPI0036517749